MIRRPDESARGYSLIELVVSISLGVLVLTIVGGMLASTLNAQASVREAAQASGSGQLVAQVLTRDVRAARAITTTPPDADTCLLRLTVVANALTTPISVQYVAWYFGNGEIRSKRSASAIPVPTSPASVANWTLLAEDVQKSGSTPVFSTSGSDVVLSLKVAGVAGAPVLIQTTASSRQPMPTPSAGGSTPCS